MTKKKAKKRITSSLSDRKLFEIASEFENAKSLSKKYEADPEIGWRSLQSRIVDELKRRNVKSLVDSALTKITLVAPESVVYDEEGMWADLTPARRRAVFDRQINLALLPKDVQEALLDHLTPAQRKRVVSHRLSVDRLSDAVQEGKIPASFVAKHSEIKESAAYVKVSRGEA